MIFKCKYYDPMAWNKCFAWLPTTMKNGDIVWLEHYEEQAYNMTWAGWDYHRRALRNNKD